MEERLEIQIPAGTPKTRLEDFLFAQFPNLSRMYLRRIVRDEKCEVNGRLENVGYRLRGGDFIELEVDLARENSMKPEEISLDIVFEDDHLIVVNKPAGMLVHPTNRDKNGTLLNALVFHLNRDILSADRLSRNAVFRENTEYGTLRERSSIEGRGSQMVDFIPIASASNRRVSGDKNTESAFPIRDSAFIRPGLVHRLDKQTSGLIAIAKSARVHRSLARQLQRKYVEKKYLALVEGVVQKDNGIIDASIGRFADQKRWDVKEGGKSSETRFAVRERYADSTLLELEPVTGRTNQLRIHCASIGHPIIGDVTRGGRVANRLMLHAWRLAFRHPISRELLTLETSVDPVFHALA